MWMFTPIGFFSATVVEPESKSYAELPLPTSATREVDPVVHVMVRARVYDDLNNLAFVVEHLLGYEPEVYALKGHDYPYRIVIPRDDWAKVAGNLAAGIDYPNFKNAVTAKQGPERHDLYMRVWSDLYNAEDELVRLKQRRKTAASRRVSPDQSTLEWASPGRYRGDDPRSPSDMEVQYAEPRAGTAGFYTSLESDLAELERQALVMDPPKRRRKRGHKRGKSSK